MRKIDVIGQTSESSETESPLGAETDVYAIHGADPEVLAYAMAKYSRSALTMRQSLAEISAQRAEQFLNTFYFQYGHRSIADLAHIPFAVERLSLLAAIEVVDEQRWDGQERSTRYQNFRESGWFMPDLGTAGPVFRERITALFAAYEHIGEGMLEALRLSLPCPEMMKPEAYERTLKARAFDVARYLLPLATNTSLGQIVNARTLETQVSRLLSSEYREVRSVGEKLRHAASEPVWNVQHGAAQELCARISLLDEKLGAEAEAILLRPVKAAPTLVKYATPSVYLEESRRELAQAAGELMAGVAIAPAQLVDLLDDEALEIELATSLLYPHCHFSYRQLRLSIMALAPAQVAEIIKIGTADRGRHDELLRGFSSGTTFRFDILMDIGGFRDMHRHRRCIQLRQAYTDVHGYADPTCPGQPTLGEAGLDGAYREAMETSFATYRQLRSEATKEAESSARYCLPLGTLCRSLFKMDFAEALYITELRSGGAGHFSYRRVAWEMYKAVADRYPSLAEHFRISDVNVPVDLLRR